MVIRTAVLFPGSLGDFLCVLPALYAISHLSPGRIDFIGQEWLFEMAQSLPFVTRTISINASHLANLFLPDVSVKSETLSFFSSISGVYSWFGRAYPEVRANLNRVTSGPVQSFDFFVGQEDCHACSYYLRCVGIQDMRCPSLTLGKREGQWLDLYWKACGWQPSSKILMIHPGSGGRKKRWEINGFTKVARWWRESCGGEVLILLGPAEEQEEILWRQLGRVAKALSLLQIAALLSRADLYLGNDSGVSHLAGAVGARGVVLFGPTDPQNWRPLGGSLSVLQNAAYRAKMPNVPGISLLEVSAEEVIAALLRQRGTSLVDRLVMETSKEIYYQ